MIRVCYVNRNGLNVLNSNQNIGGGQLQNLREAVELAKDPLFDVHMLVEGDRKYTFTHEGVTVSVIPRTNIFTDPFRTYSAFKKIDADFYISRTVTKPQMIYEPLTCKLMRKIYLYREIVDPNFILEQPLIARKLYKAGLRLADAVISNAHHIKEKLTSITTNHVLNINVPILIIKPVRRNRKHIIWVGRADDSLKRPELFLELAKRFPKEKFVMLIAGEYTAQLPSNVTVKYNVHNKDIDQYYAASKMLVQTSRSEGFGNVYLEAWRNKTPVVSLTVDPDDVLKRYGTGKHSVTFEQMVKDVNLLLTNKKEWKKCSENGYKYVRKNHDIKKIIEQYKELFLKSL